MGGESHDLGFGVERSSSSNLLLSIMLLKLGRTLLLLLLLIMMIIIIIIMTIVVNRDQSWILTGKTTWSGALVFPGQTDRRTGGRTDGRTDKKMVRLPVCLRQTGKLYSNKNKTKKVKKVAEFKERNKVCTCYKKEKEPL